MYHANGNLNKAGMAMLLSDKANLKQKSHYKEHH